MNAIMERAQRRRVETIYAEMDAQRRIVNLHLDLASDYYAIDLRPMLVVDGTVSRIGPDPVPQILRDALSVESRRYAELQAELVAAYDAERRERDSHPY